VVRDVQRRGRRLVQSAARAPYGPSQFPYVKGHAEVQPVGRARGPHLRTRVDRVRQSFPEPTGSGETPIARFVASWLAGEGLDVDLVEPIPGRPSVVGVLPGTGGGPSLMLNAHMDTVGAGEMGSPFDPVVADGRVYGRGPTT